MPFLLQTALSPARSAVVLTGFLLGSLVSAQSQASTAKAMPPADRTSLRKALEDYDQGKPKEAEPVLRDLAKRYPNSFEANEALGSLYLEADATSQALPYLKRACTLSPKDALAHANLGALYLKTSKAPEAVQELELAAKLDPANGQTQANLGQALMLAKQPKDAARAFNAAAAAAPNDPDLRYNQALALFESGSAREAGEVLDALPPASLTPEMHSLAGDADEKAGEFTRALAHYEAAAKANPSDASLYAVVAELLRHWNWEEAIQIADYGATRYPSSIHFPMASGIARYAKGDYPAAVGIFSKLLQADSNNLLAADLLGRSCGALADGENSGCAVIETYAQQHPGNAVMTTYAAVAILHAPQHEQNLDKAASLLQSAITDDPKYAEAYLRMGMLEQVRLHWAESAPYLEKAVALNPTAPEPHYRLSRAYAHLGRNDDAKAQIALHKTYSQNAKDSLDAKLQEVMRFILNPS